MLCNGDNFTYDGREFRASFHDDDSMGAPWDEHDGHGPVSDWTTRAKTPGELVLAIDGRSRRFYDFAEACGIARNCWGARNRQEASEAARKDFDRLRAWCSGAWYWIGIEVAEIDAQGEPTGRTESLWGLDSDAGDYLREMAEELAAQIIDAIRTRDDLKATTWAAELEAARPDLYA